MGNYTREEILAMAEEEDVEFIRLQFYRYVWNSEKILRSQQESFQEPWITSALYTALILRALWERRSRI